MNYSANELQAETTHALTMELVIAVAMLEARWELTTMLLNGMRQVDHILFGVRK